MRGGLAVAGLALVLLALALLLRREGPRWRRPLKPVSARVIGHRSWNEDHSTRYAAIFAFDSEGAAHEVTDPVFHATRRPPTDTIVTLRHPVGRPDLARPDRPWTMAFVFAVLIAMGALLGGILLGRIE